VMKCDVEDVETLLSQKWY